MDAVAKVRGEQDTAITDELADEIEKEEDGVLVFVFFVKRARLIFFPSLQNNIFKIFFYNNRQINIQIDIYI